MIDILVPTLGRPHALHPLAENIAETTPPDAYTLLFVIDRDDAASREAAQSAPRSRVLIADGTYPTKINAGFRATNEPLVVPTADDVVMHPGWLEAAEALFEDPAICVVGTDDLSPSTADRSHATMPILRRSYCEFPGAAWDERGTVFHGGYRHNFVETETCQLAQHRGVWVFAEESVIEHLHPVWGKREIDETDHKGNMRGWDHDSALFERRREQWLSQ